MTTNPVTLSPSSSESRPIPRPAGRLDTPRIALLVLLGAIVLGAASLLYLNLAATVATSSTRLQELSKERRMLEWQRTEKAGEMARLANPQRLEQRANELGYRAARAFTYITVSPDVAAALDHRPLAAPPAEPATEATLGGWSSLKQQFQHWLAR